MYMHTLFKLLQTDNLSKSASKARQPNSNILTNNCSREYARTSTVQHITARFPVSSHYLPAYSPLPVSPIAYPIDYPSVHPIVHPILLPIAFPGLSQIEHTCIRLHYLTLFFVRSNEHPHSRPWIVLRGFSLVHCLQDGKGYPSRSLRATDEESELCRPNWGLWCQCMLCLNFLAWALFEPCLGSAVPGHCRGLDPIQH